MNKQTVVTAKPKPSRQIEKPAFAESEKNVRSAERRSATRSPMPLPKNAIPKPVRRKIGSENDDETHFA